MSSVMEHTHQHVRRKPDADKERGSKSHSCLVSQAFILQEM